MTDQLQDLLQRVYDEGVAKAKAEAEKIIQSAQDAANETVSKANAEAEEIIANAQAKSADLAKNSDSDLKMAAQHTINSVKQRLTDIILQEALDAKLKNSFSDPAFLKEIILASIHAWKASGAEGGITISESMQGKLDEGFLGSLGELLGSGIKVQFSPAMKNGFSLSPSDGSYKLSFTDEDFASLFKTYLRPRTAQMLFSQ